MTVIRPRVVTIGVYGSDEEGFYRALQTAGIGVFCDIRLRRGMRGRQYAFVNSAYLQQRLAALNIRYIHCKDLAPSQNTRQIQKREDARAKTSKRERTRLSDAFVAAYEQECLQSFDASRFVTDLCRSSETLALFCVERDPEACHRSILAERFHRAGYKVENVQP